MEELQLTKEQVAKRHELLAKYDSCIRLTSAASALGTKFYEYRDGAIAERELETMGGWDTIAVDQGVAEESDCYALEDIQFLIACGNVYRKDTRKRKKSKDPVVPEKDPETGQLDNLKMPPFVGGREKLYLVAADKYQLIAGEYKNRKQKQTSKREKERGRRLREGKAHVDEVAIEKCQLLHPKNPVNGWHIPFDRRSFTINATIRAIAIGLRYPQPEDTNLLIETCLEDARLTHNHPMGFLPAIAMASFISYALRGDLPIPRWGQHMLKTTLPIAVYIVQKTIRCVGDYTPYFEYFTAKWEEYLETRMIAGNNAAPYFSPDFEDSDKRDEIYERWACGGRVANDANSALMIAYDAIMWAACNEERDRWNKVLDRAALHSGDSFNSAALAGALFGALWTKHNIVRTNYSGLPYEREIEKLAMNLVECQPV